MIDLNVTLNLPKPWADQQYEISQVGGVSFLVGPNGSGKSRFASTLKSAVPNARLLGTDRLQAMSLGAMAQFYGDQFAGGFQRNQFSTFRAAGDAGSGIDAFVILEERPDIRVIVEATLSSLFSRDIILEWDSGNLVPKARMSRTGDIYRMDRDECHGIRELLILLTHLHYDRHALLIIDEPELNLHPQFQSFLLQEIRKIAGTHIPGTSQKGVMLITHSPFILDLRSIEDLKSIFSFGASHDVPKRIGDLDRSQIERFTSLIPRLNVHHKQLFFADNPIFVEGISDAQFIEAVQECRKASITAAGSCVIDTGGCEEVTKYVNLCGALGKMAHFIFDLDSLFTGSLRQCLRSDGTISEFLANVGVGSDLIAYCGLLDRELTNVINAIESNPDLPPAISDLKNYFNRIANDPKKLGRQRNAILIAIASNRTVFASILGEQIVGSIEGRMRQIQAALRAKNIHLLGGGAIEHYMPNFSGDKYTPSEASKKAAIYSEIAFLSDRTNALELEVRYGELFSCIECLPAKPTVDFDSVLRRYVSGYIHDLQSLVVSKPGWGFDQVNAHFGSLPSGISRLVTISEFERRGVSEFRAVLKVRGSPERTVHVSHETNAGMQHFSIC